VPVIFECWYLGQETGRAVAEVLFGDSTRRQAAHHHSAFRRPLPAFYNHKPSARRGYLFDDVTPLYPFGLRPELHHFHHQESSGWIRRRSSTALHARVGGRHEHRETRRQRTVQMYIRDCIQFRDAAGEGTEGLSAALSLLPGETKTVTLDITPELLAFYDVKMKYVVEPGEFEIMVGNSSRDADLQKVILTVQ
jgi:beta-glucosidase